MTNSQRMRLSAVMISSTLPSAKYSCSGSPLICRNGSAAIDGLSGSGRPAWVCGVGADDAHETNPDWSGTVLEALLANVVTGHIEPARRVLLDARRDADATRLASSGDVHSIA